MNDRGSSPPGVVLRGKIKVDARKAIRKLRDHLLVDLHLWACEIVRVAVATGATRLDVTWDTDDVVLTFDGRGLAPVLVARARDQVLSPDPSLPDGDALRLLGVGVSAALGLYPRFVDVVTAEHGAFTRVRFESRRAIDDETEELPVSTPAPPPPGLTSGIQVHVRKKVRLGDLGRLVRGEQPPEVPLLLDATRDAPLTITLKGQPLPGRLTRAVLQVDLDEPSLTRGHLEILSGPATMPLVVFLEQGVKIASASALGLREAVASDLPVRVIVDAARLPMNASRSEVRFDAQQVARLSRRVPAALAIGLEALAEAALRPGRARAADAGAAPLGHTVTFRERDPAALERVLGSLAADVAIAQRNGIAISGAEKKLLSLPLLRDAVGRALSLSELRGGTAASPLHVLDGPAPEAPALAPWLEGVIWQSGRPAERALSVLVCTPATTRLAIAKAGLARRARALAHAPSPPVLSAPQDGSAYVFEDRFAVPSGPFAGLTGAVGVLPSSVLGRRPVARVFVDDRLLEDIVLPGLAFRVDMALSWPGKVVAQLAYDAVERNAELTQAMHYALCVAARGLGERANDDDDERVRHASVAVLGASRALGDESVPRAILLGLYFSRVWPASSGGHLTLDELDRYAQTTRALVIAPPGAPPARDGRPILVDRLAREVLPLLGPPAEIVDYSQVLARGEEGVQETLTTMAKETWLHVRVERENLVGFVGLGPNRRRILHGGILLREGAYGGRRTPVLVVLEDRAAVPSADYRGLVHASPGLAAHLPEEADLLELVMEAIEDGAVLPEAYRRYFELAFEDLREWIELAKPGTEERSRLVALRERLAGLPSRLERTIRHRKLAAIRARPLHAELTSPEARHAVAEAKGARITTTLCATPHPFQPATVLLDGRPAGTSVGLYPADVVIDVHDDALLKDDGTLTTAGERLLRASTYDALVALVKEALAENGFANDAALLALCDALAAEEVALETRMVMLLRAARWPTVQGSACALGLATRWNTGRIVYPAYLAGPERSPFDEPALHVPPGDLGTLRAKVLVACGATLTDVSEALAQLQSRRARGVSLPAPTFADPAPHPSLRTSLGAFGARLSEGELEITASATASVILVDDEGASRQRSLPLRYPVRVIHRRFPGATEADVVRELDLVAARAIRSLAGSLDTLPAFVRILLRRVVCEGLGDLHAPAADAGHPVFPDVRGFWWSLAQLHRASLVRYTTDPAPAAGELALDRAQAFLVLGPEEARALSVQLAVEDATLLVRRTLAGQARRTAPPVAELRLTDEMRARCIFSVAFDEGGQRGELGFLAPGHGSHREVAVLTTRRPVTSFVPDAGWPLVACVDVDDLATTPSFDALAAPADEARIESSLRAVAGRRGDALLATPADALASVTLPLGELLPVPTGPAVPCLAVFWLTPHWPATPLVDVTASDGRVQVQPGTLTAGSHGILPVAGRVLLAAGGERAAAALRVLLLRVKESLISSLLAWARAGHGADDAELRAYAWDLRLLGVLKDESPFVELGKARPDPALVRVVEQRAPALLARAPEPPAPAPTEPEAAGEMFAGLVRSVAARVRPRTPTLPPPSPLASDLLARLERLALSGQPVVQVHESSRGRAVRYEARERSVFVNTEHDDVKALPERARGEHLLLAALSEVNRELESVTDGEEIAALAALLRDG